MREAINRLAITTLILGIFSIATSSAIAGNESSSTLEITNDGTFNVTVCAGGNFAPVGVTSSQGGTTSTVVTICYEDDTTSRDAHSVILAASDFSNTKPDSDATISAGNMRVNTTWSPVRVAIDGCTLEPFGEDVGLIYATGSADTRMPPVDSAESAVVFTWEENSFENPVTVGSIASGKGTASCEGSSQGVTASVELELQVPAGQEPGDYISTLSIDVPVVTEPE